MSDAPSSEALWQLAYGALGGPWGLLLIGLLLLALTGLLLLGRQHVRPRAPPRSPPRRLPDLHGDASGRPPQALGSIHEEVEDAGPQEPGAAARGSDGAQPIPSPPRAAASPDSAENHVEALGCDAAPDGRCDAALEGQAWGAASADATGPAAGIAHAVRRRTRYPLVLVHGVMGFERVALGPLRGEYFRGVRVELLARGFDVHVVRVDPFAPIRVRAAQLARQLRELRAPRVNLVAHSMGGLDARFAIAHLGLASKVASLTTIGTPHHGTPVADQGTRWLGEGLGLRRLASAIGAETGAFWDLTTGHMQRFNAEVPDAKEVFYASVLSSGGRVHPLLRATHRWLSRRYGPSDGLVPLDSQRWGTVISEVEADHWAQVGWGGGFDAPAFYAHIGESLGQRDL